MAVTLPAFIALCPAFSRSNPATVQATLDAASLLLDAEVLGVKYDTAVYYKAAHMLSLDPNGMGARLDPKAAGDGATTYKKHLDDILRSCGPDIFVAGETDEHEGW